MKNIFYKLPIQILVASICFVIIIAFIHQFRNQLSNLFTQVSRSENSPNNNLITETESMPLVQYNHYTGLETVQLFNYQGESIGTITREITPTTLTHKVKVNLNPAPPSRKYFFWIQKKSDGSIFNQGELIQTDENTYEAETHHQFDPSDSFSFEDTHNHVIISLEKDYQATEVGSLVATGNFLGN